MAQVAACGYMLPAYALQSVLERARAGVDRDRADIFGQVGLQASSNEPLLTCFSQVPKAAPADGGGPCKLQ